VEGHGEEHLGPGARAQLEAILKAPEAYPDSSVAAVFPGKAPLRRYSVMVPWAKLAAPKRSGFTRGKTDRSLLTETVPPS
jgi:hypothetical protein